MMVDGTSARPVAARIDRGSMPSVGEISPAARRFAGQLLRIHPSDS
jgi:hypothetical protein